MSATFGFVKKLSPWAIWHDVRRARTKQRNLLLQREEGRRMPQVANTRFHTPSAGIVDENERARLIACVTDYCTKNPGAVEIDFEAVQRLYPDLAPLYAELERRVFALVSQHFPKDNLEPEYSVIHRRGPGKAVPPHADNAKFDPAQGGWVSHRRLATDAVPRSHSAILYLSNIGQDFDGGVFTFVNSPEAPIRPRSGDAILFTSGPENVHEVSAITRGIRCDVAFWYRQRT